MPKTLSARIFVAFVIVSGLLVLGDALRGARSIDTIRFVSFLLVACLAARLRVKLPGVTGVMSVNLPFILVAAAELGTVEALAVGCISTFVQCLPRFGKKFNLVQAVFNFSNMAMAVAATRLVYQMPALTASVTSPSLRLAIAAAAFFLVNTVSVAIVISLTEGVNALGTWAKMFQLSFAYFVASAGVAGVVLTLTAEVGWQVPLAVLPVMLGVFHSYRRYFAATAFATQTAFQVDARRSASAHV